MSNFSRRSENPTKESPARLKQETGPDDKTSEAIKQFNEEIRSRAALLSDLNRLAKEEIFTSGPEYKEIHSTNEIGQMGLKKEHDAEALTAPDEAFGLVNAIFRASGLAEKRKLKPEIKDKNLELSGEELAEAAKKHSLDPAEIKPGDLSKRYVEQGGSVKKEILKKMTEQEMLEKAGQVFARRLDELEKDGADLIGKRQGLERYDKELESTKDSFEADDLEKFKAERQERSETINNKQQELNDGLETIRSPFKGRREILDKALVELSSFLKDVSAQEETFKTEIKGLQDKLNKVSRTQEISQSPTAKNRMEQWEEQKKQAESNSQAFRGTKESLNNTIAEFKGKLAEVERILDRVNKIGKTAAELRQAKTDAQTGKSKEKLPVEPGVSSDWQDNALEGMSASQYDDAAVAERILAANERKGRFKPRGGMHPPKGKPPVVGQTGAENPTTSLSADFDQEAERVALRNQAVDRRIAETRASKVKSPLAPEAPTANVAGSEEEAVNRSANDWAEEERVKEKERLTYWQKIKRFAAQKIFGVKAPEVGAPKVVEEQELDALADEANAEAAAERERQEVSATTAENNIAEASEAPTEEQDDDSSYDDVAADERKRIDLEQTAERILAANERKGRFKPKGGMRAPKGERLAAETVSLEREPEEDRGTEKREKIVRPVRFWLNAIFGGKLTADREKIMMKHFKIKDIIKLDDLIIAPDRVEKALAGYTIELIRLKLIEPCDAWVDAHNDIKEIVDNIGYYDRKEERATVGRMAKPGASRQAGDERVIGADPSGVLARESGRETDRGRRGKKNAESVDDVDRGVKKPVIRPVRKSGKIVRPKTRDLIEQPEGEAVDTPGADAPQTETTPEQAQAAERVQDQEQDVAINDLARAYDQGAAQARGGHRERVETKPRSEEAAAGQVEKPTAGSTSLEGRAETVVPERVDTGEAGSEEIKLSVGQLLTGYNPDSANRKEKKARKRHFGSDSEALMTKNQAVLAVAGFMKDGQGADEATAMTAAEKFVEQIINQNNEEK